MKNKIIHLVLLLLLSTATTPILAQEQCGTELTQGQIDYMNATREARESINKAVQLKSNTVTIIPMVAHIVGFDSGNDGLTRAQLNTAMAQLNEAFEQVDFEFELCEINYINNTAYVGMEKSRVEDFDEDDIENAPAEYQMAYTNRVEGKLNVFFIPHLDLGGWASFPSYAEDYGKDWIVMNNSSTTNGSTFPHEVGHWFNLYHTHQEEWDVLDITEAELVDGSNCGVSGVGDELCDTPADPLLRDSNTTPDCVYIGIEEDANDDLYNPDATNIMSYAPSQCRTFFSPQQIVRMQTSYEFDRMSSLSACTTSLDCEITSISVSNTTTCNDNGTPDDMTDDYFEGDVTVNYFGTGIGWLYARVANDYDYKFTSGHSDYTHTFRGIKMPANGLSIGMTAYFHGQPDCSFTDEEVHRGTSCDPCYMNPDCDPCNMEIAGFVQASTCNNNGTPEWEDDFFGARIRITRPNWPTTGTLDITGDVQLSIPVEQLNNDDGYHYLPFAIFPANGQPISLTATFSDDDCSTSRMLGGKYPCSTDCRHNANITQTINDNYFKEVHNYIRASNKILSGADAAYDARVKITLEPGFHAQNGSKFHAYLEGCPDNVENREEPLVSELDAKRGYLRNYPNPFTGQTTIEFVLTQDTPVTLFVSDVTGKQVAMLLNKEAKTQGTHSVTFDGNNYPAGMYYYTIQAGDLYGTQKMILAK